MVREQRRVRKTDAAATPGGADARGTIKSGHVGVTKRRYPATRAVQCRGALQKRSGQRTLESRGHRAGAVSAAKVPGSIHAEHSAGRGARLTIPKAGKGSRESITFVEGCKTSPKYKNTNCLSQNTGFSICGICKTRLLRRAVGGGNSGLTLVKLRLAAVWRGAAFAPAVDKPGQKWQQQQRAGHHPNQ